MSIRVTDSYLSSILVGDLNRSLGAMLKQQRMAGSMRRVNSFADDPRAVGTIQRYNALISNNDEYIKNITRSRIIVDGTDVALQNISEVLSDVRVISLRESSALGTARSMATTVVEVTNLANRLMDVLNTTVEGNYIFAGRAVQRPPFVRSNGSVIYQGDNQQTQSRTGPNSMMGVNIPGNVFMGSQSSTLGGSVDMAPRIQPATLLSDLDLGRGWTAGSISLTDGTGSVWEVDLSGALTIADVTSAIATATGGAVTAGIDASGKSLTLAGTGPLTVGEAGGGTTAASLGLNANSDANLLTGRDIRPAAQGTTLLADVQSLAGKLPLGVINVAWQGSTYAVDLSAATTLDDLRTAFNSTVPGMELEIRDSGLAVIGSSPELFTITNADATNSATALGIHGDGNPVRLFGLLEDLQAALAAGDKDKIRGAMNELSALEGTISQLTMTNGGRQTDLDWADGVLRQRDERLRGNLSLEYDADVAQVAADLSRAETSYQASLLVTSKLYQMNLMQYLR
jgi:flagellin-like hook-associated protein FlgL